MRKLMAQSSSSSLLSLLLSLLMLVVSRAVNRMDQWTVRPSVCRSLGQCRFSIMSPGHASSFVRLSCLYSRTANSSASLLSSPTLCRISPQQTRRRRLQLRGAFNEWWESMYYAKKNYNLCISKMYIHSLRTHLTLLRKWRHCNLWRHRPLKGNDSQHQRSWHFLLANDTVPDHVIGWGREYPRPSPSQTSSTSHFRHLRLPRPHLLPLWKPFWLHRPFEAVLAIIHA